MHPDYVRREEAIALAQERSALVADAVGIEKRICETQERLAALADQRLGLDSCRNDYLIRAYPTIHPDPTDLSWVLDLATEDMAGADSLAAAVATYRADHDTATRRLRDAFVEWRADSLIRGRIGNVRGRIMSQMLADDTVRVQAALALLDAVQGTLSSIDVAQHRRSLEQYLREREQHPLSYLE